MKGLRAKKGLSQQQLAVLTGISQSYISRIEKGDIGALPIGKLVRIANTTRKEVKIMQGHIRKHGSGYQYTIELGRDPLTGKRKQKSKGGFRTKKEAQVAMAKMIVKLEKGEYAEEKKITMEEYFEKWLNYMKHNVAPNTYVFYSDIVEKVLVPNLGKAQLSKLNAMHIQTFLTNIIDEKGISTTTAGHYYKTLNAALNQAVKWGILASNPCAGVTPPKKAERPQNVLEPDQVTKLLEFTKTSEFPVMYIPLLLAVFCGLRRGEILGLRWSDVVIDNRIIKIRNNIVKSGNDLIMKPPKTENSERTIAITEFTATELIAHRKEQLKNSMLLGEDYNVGNFVCTWPDGTPLLPDYLTHTFKKILKKANLPDIRFHDLRHTHATMLLLQNVNPKIVQERLGHKKIDTTLDVYSHVLPQMQKEAVEKLEDLFQSTTNNSNKS